MNRSPAADASSLVHSPNNGSHPGARVLAVYRAIYSFAAADACDLETLAAEMERRYGVPFGSWPPDVTRGRLFEQTTLRSAPQLRHGRGRPGGR
jgi:hypothetical protein